MDKKYIIYVGGFILPDGNAAAHRVVANAKILQKFGYEVILLGTKKTNTEKNSDIFSTEKIINGFKSYSTIYPTNIKNWFYYLSSIKEIKEIINRIGKEKVHSIIAYNYQSIALNKILQFCKKTNIKLIADSTEWQIVKRENIFITSLKNMDTFYRMKILHKKLNGIIAISSHLYNYYKSRMKNVLLLPPLVDMDDEKWSNNINRTNQRCELVYAGSPGIGEKDRLDKIITALSKIKNQHKISFYLTIVGLTKNQYLKSFGKEAIPDNISDEVLFKGRLTHLETIKVIHSSDYSIFLRDDNLITKAGFPTKFVESISCGIPVLTNLSSNIEEYLADGKFGFLLNTSSEDLLVESLYKAITLSHEEIEKLKNVCKLSKRFDYRSFQNEMQNFIKSLKY